MLRLQVKQVYAYKADICNVVDMNLTFCGDLALNNEFSMHVVFSHKLNFEGKILIYTGPKQIYELNRECAHEKLW